MNNNRTVLFAREDVPATLIPDRVSGLFYQTPNYCFIARTSFPYSDGYWESGVMRLIVYDSALNRFSIAESPILGSPKVTDPKNDFGTYQVSLYNNPPFSIKYLSVGAAYEVKFIFYFIESGENNVETSVEWRYEVEYKDTELTDFVYAKQKEIPCGGDYFYKKLSKLIKVDPQVNRLFKSLSIHVYAYDPVFRIYQNFENSGLDIDARVTSNFTNGIGLFAVSRRTEINDLQLDYRSLDSLVEGQFTKNLNFKKW